MPPKQSREDPLALSGLDPERIDEAIQEKKVKPPKPPSEIEIAKEQRLLKKEERLAGGGASSSAAPPPADNYAARSKLLDKLGAYRERFPWLKSRNKTVKNMEEIEDELHYFELQLNPWIALRLVVINDAVEFRDRVGDMLVAFT